jgi:hypothetical protein
MYRLFHEFLAVLIIYHVKDTKKIYSSFQNSNLVQMAFTVYICESLYSMARLVWLGG